MCVSFLLYSVSKMKQNVPKTKQAIYTNKADKPYNYGISAFLHMVEARGIEPTTDHIKLCYFSGSRSKSCDIMCDIEHRRTRLSSDLPLLSHWKKYADILTS